MGSGDPSPVQRVEEGYQYGDGVSPPSINAEWYLHRCTPHLSPNHKKDEGRSGVKIDHGVEARVSE